VTLALLGKTVPASIPRAYSVGPAQARPVLGVPALAPRNRFRSSSRAVPYNPLIFGAAMFPRFHRCARPPSAGALPTPEAAPYSQSCRDENQRRVAASPPPTRLARPPAPPRRPPRQDRSRLARSRPAMRLAPATPPTGAERL